MTAPRIHASRSLLPLFALALVACAAAPSPPAAPCPTAKASPPASPTAAPSSPPAAPLLALYLPKERAAGSPYCLDPDSAAAREVVKRARPEATDRLPAAALADDVADLHAALKKIYAGYPELLQDRHFDVERFFAEWEARLRGGAATVTFGEGVVEPLVTLRKAHRDNHLAPWGWGYRLAHRPELAVAEYQARAPLSSGALSACTFSGAAPLAGTLRVTKLLDARGDLSDLATFSAMSTEAAITARCGAADVRFERRASPARGSDEHAPVYEWRATKDATIVTVRRLWGNKAEEATLERLAADYASHAAKPTIVFDFRGNGGGNDGYVFAWIEKAVKGTWRPPYFEVRDVGAALPCGDWNNLVADQIRDARVDSPAAKAERDAYWKETTAALASAPVQAVDLSDVTTGATSPYHGRVFVLVDAASGSSGESGPEMLHAAMGATIVGERTGGYMEYGNVRPWVMPRTGIVWGVPSKRNYYPEPREAVGTPPAVVLSAELLEKPVEDLLPLLARIPR